MTESAPETYTSTPRYLAARARFALLRGLLRTTATWSPMSDPLPGYSIVIGVPVDLWDLLDIPLLSLQRASLPRCREVILAVDAMRRDVDARFGADAVNAVTTRYASLRPRFLFYSPWQNRVCRLINWNWVDCWLTWVMGLAEARTNHVLLHDFDAVVVDPEFCERHYDRSLEADAAFTGIQRDFRHYGQQGSDLLMTVELLLDAHELRTRFQPIDLFTSVRRVNGRRIQFDILRDVQVTLGDKRRTIHEVHGERLVHPSQVISQWHELRASATPFRPRGYTPLFAVPFFRLVGGDATSFDAVLDALKRGDRVLPIESGRLDTTELDQAGRDWIADQIGRLNRYFAPPRASDVDRYCELIRQPAQATG